MFFYKKRQNPREVTQILDYLERKPYDLLVLYILKRHTFEHIKIS